MHDFLLIADRSGAEDIDAGLLARLHAECDEMFPVLAIIRKSDITARLKEQDRLRDTLVYGFMMVVQAFRHHPDVSLRDAAGCLMTVFNHYRQFSRKTYDENSTAISEVVQELNSGKFAENVKTLGLGTLVDHLALANETFFHLMHARYIEETKRPDVKARDARAAVEKTLGEIIDRVAAAATLQGLDLEADFDPATSSTLEVFARDYNAIATRYKHVFSLEKGRRAAAKREKNEKK